jgi:hypothetical protein
MLRRCIAGSIRGAVPTLQGRRARALLFALRRPLSGRPSRPGGDSAPAAPGARSRGSSGGRVGTALHQWDPSLDAKIARIRRLEEEIRLYGAPRRQVPFILSGGVFALGIAFSGWLFYWGILPLARRLEREVPPARHSSANARERPPPPSAAAAAVPRRR